MNNNIGGEDPQVQQAIPVQNSVRLYAQNDAMDDFPVLKAFQQYVEAEQTKAQRRMTTLCIFFAVILVVVVGVFVSIIYSMSDSKDSANERIFQLLQDRVRQHVTSGAPAMSVGMPQPQAQAINRESEIAINSLNETVAKLQKQLSDQQIRMIEEKQKAVDEAVKRVSEANKAPSAEQIAQERRNKAELDKINKATEQLRKLKDELTKEKERLHQKEVDLQRRNLYPEYYEKQDAAGKGAERKAPAPVAQPAALPPQAQEDEDEPGEEIEEEDLDTLLGTKDVKTVDAAPQSTEPAPKVTKPVKKADGSLRYFEDDEDEEVVPVFPTNSKETKAEDSATLSSGQTSGWTLPME